MKAKLSSKIPPIRDVDCGLAAYIGQNPIFGRIVGSNVLSYRVKTETINMAPQLVAPNDWDGVKEWVLRIPCSLENPDAPLLLNKERYTDQVIVVYALVWLREKPDIVFEYANIADPPIIRPLNTSGWTAKDWREASKVNNHLKRFFVNGRDNRGLKSLDRENVKEILQTSEIAQRQGISQEALSDDLGFSDRHIRRLKRKHPGLKRNSPKRPK